MSIDRQLIGQLQPGKIIALQDVIDNAPVNWGFSVLSFRWVPGKDYQFLLEGRILSTQRVEGVQERIARQRHSIDRLLEHLGLHCPKLLGTGDCPEIGKEENPA